MEDQIKDCRGGSFVVATGREGVGEVVGDGAKGEEGDVRKGGAEGAISGDLGAFFGCSNSIWERQCHPRP